MTAALTRPDDRSGTEDPAPPAPPADTTPADTTPADTAHSETAHADTVPADAGRIGRQRAGTPVADGPGILRRQAARESSARTYARSLPIVPVRARGMTVEGADGRRYLDCLSGAGTLALGHNHPVVLAAIRGVLDTGAPLHVLDLATPVKDRFVEELFATLPPELARDARIQFCGPAGTDAVEAALKLVRTATGRRGVVAFTGAYHGMTEGALAVGGDTAIRDATGAGTGDTVRLPFPQDYRCPFGTGGAEGERIAAHYARTLLTDPGGGVPAAAGMIVEPVQGEGGVLPAPDGWLREMRRLTAERGIALIADEVQTGLGRTGAMWGVDHAGVVPDVMVVSKAIGGSLPLAVVVYRAELDHWWPGAHAGTFRGNQLAMAAGTATIAFVREHRLHERAALLGARLAGALRDLMPDQPAIGEVRGRGLMLGVEIVEPDAAPDACGARPAAPRLAIGVRREALARGLIVELGGRHDSVVRLLPPLTMTDVQADAVLERLADAIEAARRGHSGTAVGSGSA
ncbi:diaminobutyrate--2-oxoglutarate transaminase family protein [Embleya sp. NBC_00888]|uniref:diaminobutyrate--2-oxoglutarate transaminase family protein n=1 Tax=Embleya sp. NBC_00888 TaxID=2975960 RepID=UPI003864BBE4|nr:diaminobutyrate--2-oxoglutarate transaminase family protein [Embleya sp. NBC_00888]